MRILAATPAAVGPEDAQGQRAEAKRFPRPRCYDRDVRPSSACDRRSLVGASARLARVEQPPTRGRGRSPTAGRRHGRDAGWVRTTADSDRSPRRRSCLPTSASGGPVSTSTAPCGTSSSSASPWPTSRKVIRTPPGGDQPGGVERAHHAVPPARTSAQITASAPRRRQRGSRVTTARTHRRRGHEQEHERGRGLRERKPGDESRRERDPCRRPAGEPRERGGRRRQDRRDEGREEPEAEERSHRRLCERVREDGPERDAPEVQPEDRARHRPAGDRDRDRPAQQPWQLERERQESEPAIEPRHPAKIATTAANESWKPGSNTVAGFHASRTSAPSARKCHRSRGLDAEPRERSEPSRDGGPHDRRLPADGERVRGDRDKHPDVCQRARDPERPRQPEHAPRDERDVLATDGEQVVETRRLEVRLQRRSRARRRRRARRPSSSASRSPVAPLASADATCRCSRSATPPIPPRRPTSRGFRPRSTTWTPRRASQPRSSKPVSGPRGATGRACELEQRALRRRPSARQLEQDRLPDRSARRTASPRPACAARTLRAAPARSPPRARPRALRCAPRARSGRARRAAGLPTTLPASAIDDRRPARSAATRRRGRRDAQTTSSATAQHARRPGAASSTRRDPCTRRRRARSASRSRAPGGSRRHQVPQLLDPRRTDAGHLVEGVDRAERTVRSSASRRSSARSPDRCPGASRAGRPWRREADPRSRGAASGSSAVSRRDRGPPVFSRAGTTNLHAVDERSGEIDRARVRSPRRPTGAADGVVDPRAVAEPVETRPAQRLRQRRRRAAAPAPARPSGHAEPRPAAAASPCRCARAASRRARARRAARGRGRGPDGV